MVCILPGLPALKGKTLSQEEMSWHLQASLSQAEKIAFCQHHLYHDAWVYQRSRHSVQYSCTVGGAFEARVYPCTLGYNEASMATVVTDKTNFHKKTFLQVCKENCML